MEHRTQHGSKKRSDEIKIYNELRNLKETKEDYTVPEPKPRPHSYWYSYQGLKKDTDYKRSTQHKIDVTFLSSGFRSSFLVLLAIVVSSNQTFLVRFGWTTLKK